MNTGNTMYLMKKTFMDWMFVSTPNLYIEALTPHVMVLWDGSFKEVIKVKCGVRVGPSSNRTDVLIRRGLKDTDTQVEGQPCEDIAGRWPLAKPRRESLRVQPCWHFDLGNLVSEIVRKFNFCCLRHQSVVFHCAILANSYTCPYIGLNYFPPSQLSLSSSFQWMSSLPSRCRNRKSD